MQLPITPIPNEILHEIFWIATGVSDPLICFEQDYHRTRRGASGRSFKHYQESLVRHNMYYPMNTHTISLISTNLNHPGDKTSHLPRFASLEHDCYPPALRTDCHVKHNRRSSNEAQEDAATHPYSPPTLPRIIAHRQCRKLTCTAGRFRPAPRPYVP